MLRCLDCCQSAVANHCRADGHPGRNCNWVRCTNKACRAYGAADGSNWSGPQPYSSRAG